MVVPSRYESFGLTAVEAMARGIVVIAARIGALEEVVGNGGVLTAPERPGEIVDAIQRLIAAPHDERALAKAALERYRTLFSLEVSAGRTDQIFPESRGARRSPPR